MSDFTEAPASNTFKVKSSNGFEHMFTMRDTSVSELLKKIDTIEKALLDRGWTPLAQQQGFPKREKPPVKYIEGRRCPVDAGHLVEPTAPNRPIKCENGSYDFATKTKSGCQYVEWPPAQP